MRVQQPTALLADLACMLLANLTKTEAAAKALANATMTKQASALGASSLQVLVKLFHQGRGFNRKADFHFLAAVLSNLTQASRVQFVTLDNVLNNFTSRRSVRRQPPRPDGPRQPAVSAATAKRPKL